MKQRIRIPAHNREPVLERIGKYLAVLPADKEYTVVVEPYKRTRSLQQNAYLWGVCYATILEQGGEALAGWQAEDIHEYMLGEWAGWETLSGFGRTRMRPLKRSSKLSTVEFADYVQFIQQKAAEMGIYIPDPQEEFA